MLRTILGKCPASTLREVAHVSKRAHTHAAALLRNARRFPRAMLGRGAVAVRSKAHTTLPARWTIDVPVEPAAAPANSIAAAAGALMDAQDSQDSFAGMSDD